MKTLSWINVTLGVWLIAAAVIFSTQPSGFMAEKAVAGVLIALLAYTSAVAEPVEGISWSVALAGLWTAIGNWAPHTLAATNAFAVGVTVLVLGTANAIYRHGHTPHRLAH